LTLIRSYMIEFYFLRWRFTRPGAPSEGWETRPPAHWACRTIRLYGANGNGVTEWQYGHGFMETVSETDTDERKRKAGNQSVL